MLGEATLDVSGTFAGEAIRLLILFAAPHVEGAQKSWRRIDGHNQLPKLILGVKFTDGVEVFGASAAPQAAA